MQLHRVSFSCFNPWNKFHFTPPLLVIGPVTASADNKATVLHSRRPFNVVQFEATETQPRRLSLAFPSDPQHNKSVATNGRILKALRSDYLSLPSLLLFSSYADDAALAWGQTDIPS